MKSSKWTLARKVKKKCYNYPYYVKKRLETETPEKIPPSSSQSVVAAAIMEDKEMMWSSDGEEAVDGGEISSSSDVNDVSVRQVHKMLDTQILSGESSIHSSNSTVLWYLVIHKRWKLFHAYGSQEMKLNVDGLYIKTQRKLEKPYRGGIFKAS
ncbi:hypothetical protein Pmani_000491 [Petrolisthes manimaculis]|uniref:Uncharacterized protein n=1 Tax=Petrolisthes manimaculis TaxID=1843537 RepID=A0AAE1UEU2_9EUCA|nr:hypothetical protein Pmani_012282 [Petrolisthes manimaculis]KAK4329140.1 hypothetical protein Pmani_000482 [Petrolisthes manimaculis]KAK4329149.1 hypothetical protein Pmani_000491 [Petrolisthes manimaculis]